MKLNMKIGKMWVPTTNYGNNRNIMETAAADSTFLGETKWCLKIINQCRLYLKIFFVSEMMGKDGKITIDWLNGRRRNNNSDYHIPDIQKPPEATWAVWKQFIFKNFITGNRKISPLMQLTTTNRPQRERSNGNDPQLLERRLELLSPQYQQILGA